MQANRTNRPVLMIFMLVLTVYFSMASRAIFSPLMPSLQEQLGLSLSAAGSFFLLISISYGLAMLFSGFLSSRIGHGLTVVAALTCISLGLLTAGAARNMSTLAAGMIVIGAGAGTYPPSGIVMINSRISAARRNTAFAFHEIGPNLALLTAPLLVIVIEPLFGWRGVLYSMSLVSMAAAVAFLRWGAPGGGKGAAPNLATLGRILKLPGTLVGMLVLSAALAGIQGVYAILPAYLVSSFELSPGYVNLILSISRISGVVLLLPAGPLIDRIGRRPVIAWVLVFSGLCTALIGVVGPGLITLVIIAQPALLAILFPAILSSLGEIGEHRYQNVTYALIITVSVSAGSGVAPALLGLFADLGFAAQGFFGLAAYMLLAVAGLAAMPAFGRRSL